jgi:hypothetical protein
MKEKIEDGESGGVTEKEEDIRELKGEEGEIEWIRETMWAKQKKDICTERGIKEEKTGGS